MDNFYQLLSPKILDRLNSKNVDIDVEIYSEDCDGRWPNCQITIGEYIIFDGLVVQQQCITASRNINSNIVDIKIKYLGKTSQDTKVNNQGLIISNQKMGISKFKLNGIDIIKNGLIYRSEYIMQLDPDKEKYFNKNNIPTSNHDYHFFENGTWTLQIGLPVLTYIINTTKQVETFEKLSYDDIMMAIIRKLEI